MMEDKYLYLDALQDGYPVVQELDRIRERYSSVANGSVRTGAGLVVGLYGGFGMLLTLIEISSIGIRLYSFGSLVLYLLTVVAGVILYRSKQKKLDRISCEYNDYLNGNRNLISFLTDEYWNTAAFQYLHKVIESDRAESWKEALSLTDIYLRHEESLRKIHEESVEVQNAIWRSR